MNLTTQQLGQILLNNHNPGSWLESVNTILPEFEINTVDRVSAFFGQCGYESDDFTRLEENLNYRGDVLWKLFHMHFKDQSEANSYAHHPEMIANRIYANRLGNGDEKSGDGWNFRGRGIIQITGRENYEDFFKDSLLHISNDPNFLTTPKGAILSACWFWKKNSLNDLADHNNLSLITERINGPAKLGNSARIKNVVRIRHIIS